MTAEEFMREMLKNVRTLDTREVVCPKCRSKNVFVMKAKNAVIGCGDCNNTEELLTYTEG